MSREISFRAWVKTKSIMIPDAFIDHWNVTDGDRFRFKREDCEVMQFTGLKDKNGRKIYEGDILNIILDKDNPFWGGKDLCKTGVVRYESDYGGFIAEWEYSKNQHHETLGCDLACTAEVLGTIYQPLASSSNGNRKLTTLED